MDAKMFGMYMLALAIMMVANTLFRLAATNKLGNFDKEKLVSGLKKNACVFLGMALVFCAGTLLPQVQISFDGNEVTLVQGVQAIILAAMAYYGVKSLMALKDLLVGKKEEVSEEVAEEDKEEVE